MEDTELPRQVRQCLFEQCRLFVQTPTKSAMNLHAYPKEAAVYKAISYAVEIESICCIFVFEL